MVESRKSPHSPDALCLLGLAGRIGAGKTSAAEYLATRHGFERLRYSQVLQDWLSDRNATKSELQSVGWNIMASGRQGELNARLVSRIDRSRKTAIDGLRHPVDFHCLSSSFGATFRLVFIEAEKANRFQRTTSRFPTLTDFEVADHQPVESHIEKLRSMSFSVITNDAALAHLHRNLDYVLERLKREGYE